MAKGNKGTAAKRSARKGAVRARKVAPKVTANATAKAGNKVGKKSAKTARARRPAHLKVRPTAHRPRRPPEKGARRGRGAAGNTAAAPEISKALLVEPEPAPPPLPVPIASFTF